LPRSTKKKQIKKSKFTTVLLGLLLIVVAFEVVLTLWATMNVSEKLRPANLQLTLLTDNTCTDCGSAESLIPRINVTGVKIASIDRLDYASTKAQQLINQYGVQKVPSILVFGETNKSTGLSLIWGQLGGRMVNGAVYIESAPPYLNLSSGAVNGRVTLTILNDSTCSQCSTMNSFVSALLANGVKIASSKTIDYTSTEGQAFISQYNIQRIPAIVISQEVLAYKNIAQSWPQLNATLRAGFYALHTLNPPYRDLATGQITGLVSVIYLNDSACTSCYDVKAHKNILVNNFGVYLANETTVDISTDQGKALIAKYEITNVPTVLVSPEASAYTALKPVWLQTSTGLNGTIGSIESDGWYVFRGTSLMGNYTDLSTGKIVGH
jgi:glutaredoxin